MYDTTRPLETNKEYRHRMNEYCCNCCYKELGQGMWFICTECKDSSKAKDTIEDYYRSIK